MEAAYAMQGNEYGFKVAGYDRARQLVIDPILAATFLGGVMVMISMLARH